MSYSLSAIRSDEELDAAVELAERLEIEADAGKMSDDRADYLEVLTMLIERYEDEHHPIRKLATPRERLAALVEAAGMNASTWAGFSATARSAINSCAGNASSPRRTSGG